MFELRARGEHDAQQANLGGVVTTDAASTFHKSQRSGALDSRECPAQQVRDLLKNARRKIDPSQGGNTGVQRRRRCRAVSGRSLGSGRC